MSLDIRLDAASYYDYNTSFPNDILFYKGQIPSPNVEILELGCGTGMVTIPISQVCRKVHGIDLSEAMIAICQEKLAAKGIPKSKITIEVGDITDFNLNRKFELIIAPFRVLQNLETDRQVEGFFECLKKHLAPQGYYILNIFKPNRDRDGLRREWCTENEKLDWEVIVGDERIECYDRRPRMDKDKLILYPELIYRKYKNNVLIDETVLKIAMRCYYPEEFEELIKSHGFRITEKWGGYNGEIYGQGSELVVKFRSEEPYNPA